MTSVLLTRRVKIPDPLKISRYRKAPELGPRLLFFSGGSALNDLSRGLKDYTHNSIHLVTPFDSGGSSSKLRCAFHMPAIGDLRSRMMALADESVTGHPEILHLFTYRFPEQESNQVLLEQLELMAAGRDPLLAEIANPMRKLICFQLGYFLKAMPTDFDLRGASIGNLILAGGYLNNHQHLDPIIFLFSKLVNVLGTVRTLVNDDLHLVAELEDGQRILGQHLLTGKELPAIQSPIQRLALSRTLDRLAPAFCSLRKRNRKLIASADLICYPPGSFFTSVLANLLPEGVGSTIAENDCPKVYVPNLGQDPELLGLDLNAQITRLLEQLRQDAPGASPSSLLNLILLDGKQGQYPGELDRELPRSLGIQVIDLPLVSQQSEPYYDNQLLVPALLSLA